MIIIKKPKYYSILPTINDFLLYLYTHNLFNNYNYLNIYINVIDYILVTIYLLLIRTSKQIFSSRNI